MLYCHSFFECPEKSGFKGIKPYVSRLYLNILLLVILLLNEIYVLLNFFEFLSMAGDLILNFL